MDYFMENNKFLSLKGILNRRNFIINFLIIEMIEGLVFVTPLFYALLFNPKLLSDFTSIKNNFPEWYLIIVAVWGIIYCLLFFPSMVRRVRDVIGVGDNNRITLISVVITVIMYASYTPIGFRFLGKWLAIFVVAILATTIGKISGDKPKSPVFKFNWGAFFGTWIWGLFNKTYITLFEILLFFTPVGMLTFPLICGLKGNEWAYKNKGCPDIEVFHKSQRMQAKIFSIVMTVGMAVIITLTSFFAVFMIGKYMSVESNRAKVEQRLNNYMESYTKQYFTKINITKNENKFYMSPEDWKNLDMDDKYQVYKLAITYAASKNGTDKYNEINKTTIYSNYNKEILAKYIQ